MSMQEHDGEQQVLPREIVQKCLEARASWREIYFHFSSIGKRSSIKI